jgi:hypothetical protein
LACSLPALETQELAAAVEAWCEILYPVVPVNRLNDCYLHAIRSRESTFAIAATEILTAWRIISSEEARQRQRAQPCRLCFGWGYGKVYDPKTDTEIVKECPHCHGQIQTAIAKA